MFSYLSHYDTPTLILLGAYFSILLVLSFYGSHRYKIVYLYRKHAKGRCDPEALRRWEDDETPVVTIQLPLYNERYVAERLIEAVCQIQWPNLEIQVLDDSTDDTTALCEALVAKKRAQGHDIVLIHRTDRTGYKAGALQAGMVVAKGEFLAIFDADFIPQKEFIAQTIHHFTDPGIGMVQARWDHINRDHSLLTRAQAILLDGHSSLSTPPGIAPAASSTSTAPRASGASRRS